MEVRQEAMKLNLGAVMIFVRRAAQMSAYLMLLLNTLKIAGLGLQAWMWAVFGAVMAVWVVLDVFLIFPQEEDYSVRRNKTLMKGLGL